MIRKRWIELLKIDGEDEITVYIAAVGKNKIEDIISLIDYKNINMLYSGKIFIKLFSNQGCRTWLKKKRYPRPIFPRQ
jgi:hypothetical protein